METNNSYGDFIGLFNDFVKNPKHGRDCGTKRSAKEFLKAWRRHFKPGVWEEVSLTPLTLPLVKEFINDITFYLQGKAAETYAIEAIKNDNFYNLLAKIIEIASTCGVEIELSDIHPLII